VNRRKPKIPHQPTKQELEDYIFDFKADLIDKINEEFPKSLDRGNDVEIKLRSDLIIFATALVTIMGAIIASQDIVLAQADKLILIIAVSSLLLSVAFGLGGYYTDASFWRRVADYKHKEGKIINDDKSQTFDELADLRNKIISYRSDGPKSSAQWPKNIQIALFGVGLITVALVAILLILQR
jgi:hypothetical protein